MSNIVILTGRLGRDAEVRTTQGGQKVANLNIATTEAWKDRNSGEWKEKTQWHRVVTWQEGLADMLANKAKSGRLVQVTGTLEYRSWRKDGEDTDRQQAEIIIGPKGSIQFLDKAPEDGAA